MNTPGLTVTALVTFDLWHVPRRRVGLAAARMLLDRTALRRTPGLTFAKLLGTGSARRFTPMDADLSRWALLAVWSTPSAARSFERSDTIRAWDSLADERWRIDLRPLASRGRWSGREPFGSAQVVPTRPDRPAGPVAAVTRARLAPRRALAFWRAVPPVAAELRSCSGLLFAAGIGEAPIGLQGTFSVWSDLAALRDFAYQRRSHVAAIRRTAEIGWYTEELFARFAVLGSRGTVHGADPLNPPVPGSVGSVGFIGFNG